VNWRGSDDKVKPADPTITQHITVKLLLFLRKNYSASAYGEVEVQPHAFLTG